eukprot:TRINITY_DN13513_c0_g1_i1.p1 TRINITY_DN13513_c0_g1~~TRINITY_DN13513_c0_g1_i1.p1  ORF type:complete len:368 (+),score=130.26 TRINITY_DN13513_c0_g1_i1:53-1156(+)
MWAPTATAAGLAFALTALCCWGSWSTTMVLTAKAMPWECFYANFAGVFLITGVVVGLVIGAVPGKAGEPAYTSELFSYDLECYGYAMLGGVMWNMANILLCKGIGLMGQALGFPMCVGLGLVSGSITNYLLDGDGVKPGFLFGGNAIALVAICAVGYLAKRKEKDLEGHERLTGDDDDEEVGATGKHAPPADGVPTARKFIICFIGGLLLGLSNIGVVGATSGHGVFGGACAMSPPANQTFFSVGVFLSSLLLVPLTVAYPVEGWAATTTVRRLASAFTSVPLRDHLLACLGGFLVCLGFFAYNLGNATGLGAAPTYSIGQSAPVVGILWGTFFFKEFEGTSAQTRMLIPAIVALFIGAIVCLALSS